jgi:hypothetical protein
MSKQAQTYPEQANELVDTLVSALNGRGKSVTVEVNLSHGAPLFGKPYVDGPTTLTIDEVITAVNTLIAIPRNSKGAPHATMEPFMAECGTVGAITGRKAAALALNQRNRNGKRVVVAGFTAGPRHDTPKRHAMAAFKAAQDGADTYTVDGLEGRTFASKADAIAFGVRAVFAEDWKDANSLENADDAQAERNALKARLVVRRNGEPLTAKTPKSTATPAATVSLSAAQAKAMAKTMGATGADLKTGAAAIAYLRSLGIQGV